MRQTISRLLQTLSPVMDIQFPLTFTASDGLDGSGSHQIYNQLQETQQFNGVVIWKIYENGVFKPRKFYCVNLPQIYHFFVKNL